MTLSKNVCHLIFFSLLLSVSFSTLVSYCFRSIIPQKMTCKWSCRRLFTTNLLDICWLSYTFLHAISILFTVKNKLLELPMEVQCYDISTNRNLYWWIYMIEIRELSISTSTHAILLLRRQFEWNLNWCSAFENRPYRYVQPSLLYQR